MFDASGLRLNVSGLSCHVTVVEHWCPVDDPHCRRDPTVTKDEPAECPHTVAPGKFSLHTPWRQVYPGVAVSGVLGVKIDWKTASVDTVSGVALHTGWSVHSDDGGVDVDATLSLTDAEVKALLAAVRDATGNDYSDAPAGERASIGVVVSSAPIAGDENHVVVSVTNHGPTPAYRVVAQLKSRTPSLQGITLPFGRIDPGTTKQRATDIPTPHDAEALIDVEAASANATRVQAPQGIRLKPKRVSAAPPPPPPSPPQLSCSAPASQVAAGKRLRVPCEASNPGDQSVKGVTYKVAIASNAPTSAEGPADLAPHAAPSKFDVDVALPSSLAPGVVQVTVMASAPDGPPVEQALSIDVVAPHKLCKPGELTVEDYRRKHKLLDEDRRAGNLTKEEFNDVLAELWSCVRSP
ncbi:MAG TPA: hypothetical protein VF516_11855 [Kofleriaceae bacterium]